mgnify:CR=1 FL=1
MTDWFRTTIGVRQGDNLSPVLFNMYVNDLITEIKGLGNGLEIGNNKLSILVYADDVVLMADTKVELQRMLDVLYQWCCKWRLAINTTKTKIIHFRNKRKPRTEFELRYDEHVIDVVDKYKYLGVFVTEHLDYNHMAEMLTGAAGRALGRIYQQNQKH